MSLAITMVACVGKSSTESYSRVTGWKYNDKKGAGFTVKKGYTSPTPSGMVAIEGGSFTIGGKGEYITAPRDNKPRRITVSSFYMDEFEIRNIDWREYTNWMKAVFGKTAPKLVQRAQPDVTVWREELAYNEPYLENYFTHPAFDQYPVVGVTWEQAMDYCQWRTDRVNELALIRAGIILPPDFSKLEKLTNVDSIANSFVFNTQKYLKQDSYQPAAGKNAKKDLYGKNRKVDMSDGILFSDFRLPTEAEWEFAAYSITSGKNGIVPEGKIYPWSGSQVRNPSKRDMGQMMANFVRGRGDMMGTSGSLNDKATITAPVDSYFPNDFGLYNMAGNVNEWVLDVYRSTSFDEMAEYNSFRGNVYLTPVVASIDALGNKVYKVDSLGRIKTEVAKGDDLRSFKDGDIASQIDFSLGDTLGLSNLKNNAKVDPTDVLRPSVTDLTRVYKGGSWKDRAYWLNPSTRRFLDQNKSSNDIGFRCAMSMIGSIDQSRRK
ncbi:MAG: SUMF1/EgtB/PvdO family nonheme iron enzyme [Bacteroidota bacterium]|nr:SUMF1/EgtB/PvdO family nonheme iron enzyme [Bacteroidota bacterium]